MEKLNEVLKYEFNRIKTEIEMCKCEGRGTPQEVSDRIESLMRDFFRKYYPLPYKVVKGQICDSFGKKSCSVDCVILNPIHPYTFDVKTNLHSILLADGVDFAIECKSNLNSIEEIERVLKQCISIKKLQKVTTGVFGGEPKYFNYHIPYIIWTYETPYNIDTLLEKIVSYYEKEKIKQIDQFDLLVINGKYIVYNIGINNLGGDNNYAKGFYYICVDEDTLSFLLNAMSNFIGAAPSFKPIISKYLKIDKDLVYCKELNARLNKINGN